MSFILDALKKAESEHSRLAGPVLMDVRITPRRQRLPGWAWILGGVLLANLLMLGWLVLQRPQAAMPPAADVSGTPTVQPAPPDAAAVPPATVHAVPVQTTASVPAPVLQAPASTMRAPASPTLATAPLPMPTPELVLPAPPPALPPADAGELPTMQQVQASGIALPPLQLNLHAYDEVPANRFVLLNSRRLREGDSLPEGIRVEQITPAGVVLDTRGRRFLLVP